MKLKPCPFCGAKAELAIWRDEGTEVHCSSVKCWATIGPLYPSGKIYDKKYCESLVQSQWNKRARAQKAKSK